MMPHLCTCLAPRLVWEGEGWGGGGFPDLPLRPLPSLSWEKNRRGRGGPTPLPPLVFGLLDPLGCTKLTILLTVRWNSHLVFSNSGESPSVLPLVDFAPPQQVTVSELEISGRFNCFILNHPAWSGCLSGSGLPPPPIQTQANRHGGGLARFR